MKKCVAVEWADGPVSGRIEVSNGRLTRTCIVRGRGRTSGAEFTLLTGGRRRLEVEVETASLKPGPESALVTVRTKKAPFSFFLRDVCRECPILLDHGHVVITEAADGRSCAEIKEAVRALGLLTRLQQIEAEPEESFEQAARHVRDLHCPTWLGVSRDMRIFEFSVELAVERWFTIQPRFHGFPVGLPETFDNIFRYAFFIGRGIGPVRDITRRLEDGVLPILHARVVDEDITFDCTSFVTMETSPLTAKALRGTHFLVADGFGKGNMLTPDQKTQRDALLPGEMERHEETVLWFRAVAINTTPVPRYAWFKTIHPAVSAGGWEKGVTLRYDPATGMGEMGKDRIHSVSLLDGKPMPQEEMAVLLKPGESCSFEFRLPHRPIPLVRARSLAMQDFDRRHNECRAFWQKKLSQGAQVRLPEPRLDEMVRAGILHLDLVTYGREPRGTLAPTIGVYCPIGSESSPIIQFLDSMGYHDIARRSLMYFMDKQHDDGFIQNFGNYMLETGPALWSMGEHWRLTRDDAWVRSIEDKLAKACDYMIAWRKRNMKPELRGRGYGMMDGKVADPEDPYHIFMLNGYAWLGMSRVAEMLAKINPGESRRIARQADALKKDIRTAFFECVAKAPVVPLGDGTWSPTVGPWAEARGPVALFADKGKWFSHGEFVGRDSALGPIYLVLQEVFGPHEPAADMLVAYGAELYHQRNAALSQPYYSPHLHVHLMRGEVKPFLKGYYNTVAALADRQTYTFWEHLFHVSPHKTHEEGWFLMQTRHMLWREEGRTLHLLPAIPRAWMESGKRIELNRVASYFGPFTLHVESHLDQENCIRAVVECRSNRRPKTVELRLPHPLGRKAARVSGGVYDASRESVRVDRFRGSVTVEAQF